MCSIYTVTAVREQKRKSCTCRSARSAISHQDDLLALGWDVSITDQAGTTINDVCMAVHMAAEAQALSKAAQAVRPA